ncbi:hypothetical protein IAE24_04555 [Delftia sp. S65]|uniref:hypothetical protein n=2 Tax=Delftia TaxID=80865 RepID=UPI0018FF423F|nr:MULTISPECIES: hypothetical protein [unclassified Delftia]MBK0111213.1 hypothetical protein [Delftia sp. S65]MBK0128386.1 hypothetical protein [Delftia sp. S66]
MNKLKTIHMSIIGMGLIFYSPFSTKDIKEGDDYLSSDFENPEKVQEQAMSGRIVAINVGSPGEYVLNIYSGYPSEEFIKSRSLKFRLGIEIRDELLCVRDLFDLIDWEEEVAEEQVLRLSNGYYHMTFLSEVPDSGVHGDNQVIDLYLQKLNGMPKLRFKGVPMLF